jgi:hypothetical protein
MVAARKQAQEATKRAQELLGHKSTHTPYRKGHWVWLDGKHLQTTHPSVKMCPKCFGPFRVTEVIGKTTYRLDIPSQWKIHNVFHANLLHPYQETQEHGCNFAEPPPELIEGQEEWEVDQILDKRTHRRKAQYLIKWKGYSDAHNSWEPVENIWAPALILAFNDREAQKSNPKKGTRTRIATLRPKNHEGTKIKPKEVPKDRKIVIKALCLGQEGGVRSEDDSSPLIQNIPPLIPLPPSSSSTARDISLLHHSASLPPDHKQSPRSGSTPSCHPWCPAPPRRI